MLAAGLPGVNLAGFCPRQTNDRFLPASCNQRAHGPPMFAIPAKADNLIAISACPV
jgi:hypothetical protein